MPAKRKWIWLRGLIRWSVHWGDFVERFKEVFPEDEIVLIDLPGFGEFNQEPSPKTMEEILNHLDKRIDWNNGKYHVLAFSLGAMVAAQWAARRPQSFEKLFLVNTSDKRSPFYRRFQLQNFGLLASRLFYIEAHFLETGILSAVSNREEIRKQFQGKFIQAFLEKPFKRQSFFRQLVIASKTRFPRAAPVETIFLNSTADRLVDHVCSQKIAQDWGSVLETHKQGGHDLALDAPDWILKTIQTHL